MSKIRPIAIHLPQFHPIPENNAWWGQGFTEWTNVTKARPFFKGHYQPHLPADLGFYDLRLEEARLAQETLAKEYGIHGFCYYHYWFNGKRLLHEPIDRKLSNPKENLPFMLCWANENWTRRWDGNDQKILVEQNYSLQDDIEHIRFLCEHFFSDSRYIRVNNKPFFIVYRISLLPSISKTIQIWREEALRLGFDGLYIACMASADKDPLDSSGFDCKIDFQPHFDKAPKRLVNYSLDTILSRLGIYQSPFSLNRVYSYPSYVDKMIDELKFDDFIHPGITPMWDNSARRVYGASIFKDSNPGDYGRWLRHIVETYKQKQGDSFVFINAWNEWAEGNHLEPCQRWGKRYLEATKQALENA
ncbi:MAG: glycoside hydrolase family 99-like domain-containing protein [Flammeovirgaceae bacterium]